MRGAVEPVEVGVGWTVDVQVAAADVEDGLVIHHESTVRVLEGGVGGQDGECVNIWDMSETKIEVRPWENITTYQTIVRTI